METRICHVCGSQVEKQSFCPVCVKSVPCWKSPTLMSPEERAAELWMWCNPAILEIPWEMFTERVDGLVGRSLYTHEYIYWQDLIKEILGEKEQPTMEQIYELLVKIKGNAENVILLDSDGSLSNHANKN